MATGRGDRGSRRISREDYARAEAELRKAVAAGKISGEDARAKLGAMRKMMGDQGERDPEAVYKAAEKKVKAAIAAGKITEGQGKARLEGLKKRLAQGARGERTRGR